MNIYALAKRYAKALLKLAGSDVGLAQSRARVLMQIKEIFAHRGIRAFMFNPVVRAELKKEVMSAMILPQGDRLTPPSAGAVTETRPSSPLAKRGSGDLPDPELQKFFEVLVEERRIEIITEIVDAYTSLIKEKQNQLDMTVTLPVSLPASTVDGIVGVIKKKLQKDVSVFQKVDPDILGGFVLEFDNSKLDLSLRAELKRLTTV